MANEFDFKRVETTTDKLDSIPFLGGQYIIIMSGAKKGETYYDSLITGLREPFKGNLPNEVNLDWTGDPTTVAVGGLGAGSIVKDKTTSQLLYDLTHPFVSPTLSMSIIDIAGLFEKKTVKSISSIGLTSIGGSEGAFKRGTIQLMSNNIIIDSANYTIIINNDTSATITFTTPIILDGTLDVVIKANVIIAGNTISASKSYNFVNPIYYGVSNINTGLVITSLVSTSFKEVKAKSTLSHSYTASNAYSYILYDKAWGQLASIIDPNNFNITSSYSMQEVTVNDVIYYLYIAKVPSSIDNFTIKFNF